MSTYLFTGSSDNEGDGLNKTFTVHGKECCSTISIWDRRWASREAGSMIATNSKFGSSLFPWIMKPEWLYDTPWRSILCPFWPLSEIPSTED